MSADSESSGKEPLVETLTRRELEVLSLLADRLSDREIAARLTLAHSSVKWYTRQIYGKLGVRDRRAAAQRARELGLLAYGEPGLASLPTSSTDLLDKQRGLPAAPAGSLVGRENEIREIQRLLLTPECRLLTLSGPGGVGKSALAQHLGHLLQETFAGVRFVALEPLPGAQALPAAIAAALGLPLRGQAEPRLQLLDQLRAMQPSVLLVLDGFEHLVDGAGLLVDILHTAPAVKLLVTSREALNVAPEWLYVVKGLDCPAALTAPHETWGSDCEPDLTCAAIQLFVDCARRVSWHFSFTDQQEGVIRICRLVEGLPLAIKLAAAWTRVLSCTAIAGEIEHNLGFLAARLRDLPERHRSIRVVFDHSWRLLDAAERDVLQNLSVFRGGFRRTAAEQVAHASLGLLATLIDQSLLQLEPDGRYHMHELIRQFAAEQLAGSPEDVLRRRNAHCAYYARYLHERQDAMSFVPAEQRRAVAEIQDELGNIRAAWQWAVEQARPGDIVQAGYTLFLFYEAQGLYLEAIEAFDLAAGRLSDGDAGQRQALADVLAYQGAMLLRLGRYDAARAALESSRQIYAQGDIAPKFATDPQATLGVLACAEGDFAEAARSGERARQMNTARGDTGSLILSLYVLTSAALGQGAYQAAQGYARQAHALAEGIHFEWFRAYILLQMGEIARALGDDDGAWSHFEASYAIRQAFDDPEGMAVALNHLGEIEIRRGHYPAAKELFGPSLAIYRRIGDRGGLAAALAGLGDAEAALDELERRALALSVRACKPRQRSALCR
jgi:predicted ATPase/DNA-binding CsgD family transcriptional regulator